ncbi:MAG: ATP-dependent DNA helicase RecG [Proteobacteria bacterium]|nr:ATP-dependent DNA helicase RecG [Pseudomonadota bacterium]
MISEIENSSPQHDAASMSCEGLKKVGPKMLERLKKCQIETIQDLLFHLPFRYQDRTRITPIGALRDGDYAVIEGVVQRAHIKPGRKASLVVRIEDATGSVDLRFFHFNASQKNSFQVGAKVRCFGEVRGLHGHFALFHPEYRFVIENSVVPVEEFLTPIYSTTDGLNQKSLRNLTDEVLALLEKQDLLIEYLPESFLKEFNFIPLKEAVLFAHRPSPDTPTLLLEEKKHPAQRRLAFEELLAHTLAMRRLRQKVRHHKAPDLKGTGALVSSFIAALPFSLTKAQCRVTDEVATDLSQAIPMMRLVQGDVGSGKTAVAVIAALQAVESGYQAAVMAPTEILAEQHYVNFCEWLKPLGIEVAWLSGKLKTKKRQEALEEIVSGRAKVIVGTHALFQEDVVFAKLGLVIIDEQHRFGVHQRMALRDKGANTDTVPHQLIMTATPIPRTLAMTAYANLDCSVIDELPPGRIPVGTIVLSNEKRGEIIERIRAICREKRQAYWVCTLIEESEVLQCQAAEITATQLIEALPELKIALIHGRMKPEQKQEIMAAFQKGDIDLLVATTVIEVGVNVPNASLMVIENPERLGLAQLHQLRGRVGRGSAESFCVLMYQSPLSLFSKQRLQIMRNSHDGFVIAQKDLELRGPGEVLGVRQTGLVHMKVADLIRDQDLIPKVQRYADIFLKQYPERVEPLIRRWVNQGERYVDV